MAVSRYCHNKKGDMKLKGTFSDYLKIYLDGKGKCMVHFEKAAKPDIFRNVIIYIVVGIVKLP